MWRSILLVVLLSPLCLSVMEAAPAPLPKPEVTGEVVFDAGDPKRAEAIRAFLVSRYLTEWLQSNQHARKALPKLNGEQFQATLKGNLSVTVEGSLVRVKLRGGNRDLLDGLTRALAGRRELPDDQEGIVWQVQRIQFLLLVEDTRTRDRKDADAIRGWHEVENEPLKVQSAPRTVRKR